MSEKKKFDTQAISIFLVRLAQDAKTFDGKEGRKDVVLTFADNSYVEGHETLWIDARVANYMAERAAGYLKGDEVQITGKVRYKRQDDGSLRGKIFDAQVASFVKLSERTAGAQMDSKSDPSGQGVPAFA